jgi:hypothetical protein
MAQYSVSRKSEVLGIGELIMDVNGEPYLFFNNALWTAQDAAQQDLQFALLVPRDPSSQIVDSLAHQIWEQALRETRDTGIRRALKQVSRLVTRFTGGRMEEAV